MGLLGITFKILAMIQSILKVEKTGKTLFRIGMAIYLLVSALTVKGGFSNPIGNILLLILPIAIGILLIGHFKMPKAGILGGMGGLLFFIFKGINNYYGKISRINI